MQGGVDAAAQPLVLYRLVQVCIYAACAASASTMFSWRHYRMVQQPKEYFLLVRHSRRDTELSCFLVSCCSSMQ